MLARLRSITPAIAVEAFVWSNLAFLGVDIALAHAENRFARREEWLPLAFSAEAAPLLLPALVSARLRERTRPLAIAIAAFSIAIGVAGMLYHLASAFFEAQTLANLVYAAPFVAPLAYVGLGLLLLLTRIEAAESAEWSDWVLFLALGGFLGNLGLSLLDHAQNGFYGAAEWVAVGAAAFGVAFLAVALIDRENRALHRITLVLLGGEALVGVVGLVLHLAADARRPGASWLERILHGAPGFAPLLFADLAVLAAIGLWSRLRATSPTGPSPR